MKVTISFKNINHTRSLDGKIKEKSEKLGKFLEGKTNLKWSCHFDDGHYYTEVSLIGPKFEYHSHSSADNIYKSMELAYQKIQKQLQKRKEKWRNKLHTRNKNVTILDPEQAWADLEDENLQKQKAS